VHGEAPQTEKKIKNKNHQQKITNESKVVQTYILFFGVGARPG
jgi:hypothetical protein